MLESHELHMQNVVLHGNHGHKSWPSSRLSYLLWFDILGVVSGVQSYKNIPEATSGVQGSRL